MIHDGDYASMTFDTGAPEYDRILPAKYFDAIVANPFVMREMPCRLNQLGVRSFEAMGAMVLEVGRPCKASPPCAAERTRKLGISGQRPKAVVRERGAELLLFAAR